MPIHISTLPEEYYDGLPVQPNTNEACVLKAVRSAPGSTRSELAETVPLDDSALSGALYRLQTKEMLVHDEEAFDLPSETVGELADALVPLDDLK
jgi:DNA-binding IclR family transcriptional regulator